MKKNKKVVEENGVIKKENIIKEQLKDAPFLKEEDIQRNLTEYFDNLDNKHTTLLLNSRDLNYVMVFDTHDKNLSAKDISLYLMDYFNVSGFMTKEKEDLEKNFGLIHSDFQPLNKIKDIRVSEESPSQLDLYVGDSISHFMIIPAEWVLERVTKD